ncbi:MAG TPA: SMI1/KNR4 family protein [Mucilaginibacter sp.]|jgi:cell wall assembly regulator SMI1|nr:SMI1/KNR4 family protein [Mucilaginibacter sp.]
MTIKEIIELIRRDKAQHGITLYEPASESELLEFEKKLHITLPQDIKDFYRFANGFESAEDIFRIIPLKEILSRIDRHHQNYFYIAEYMVYCDMWGVTIDPKNDTYKISEYSFKTALTNSFAEFLQCFLKGGVFGQDGLYDWKDKIINNS